LHSFTNKRLAGTIVPLPNDFGTEFGICVHTFINARKIHALTRENGGLPKSDFGSTAEAAENLWTIMVAPN